jgi:hypothetical protein
MFGIDTTKPLDEQYSNEAAGETWADYFINFAKDSALSVYALNDAAAAADHTLTEEEQGIIDSNIATMEMYGLMYGYEKGEDYLKSMYGRGASKESYRKYMEMSALADAYLAHYAESLSYTDDQIRDFEKEKLNDYNSYTYASCYLSYTYFLGEQKKDEDGKAIPYTDEERDAARAKAKEVAESLLTAKTFEELDMAVNKLEINKDKDGKVLSQLVASATNNKNVLGSKLPSLLKDWIVNADRKNGDSSVIVNEYTEATKDEDDKTDSTDDKTDGTDDKADGEDKKEEGKKVINGYYVVIFDKVNDNKVSTVDVHHLLKAFVDDKNDNKKDDNGKVIYTDEEKATAKKAAEDLLKKWEEMEGGKTLENFKKLVEENTDDTGSKKTGGLYENISYDQSYVEPFLNWCIDENRKVGDIEIVETEYGYHIMYFAERNEMNYRDLLITNNMRSEDTQKWYDEQLKTVTATAKDMTWIALDAAIAG